MPDRPPVRQSSAEFGRTHIEAPASAFSDPALIAAAVARLRAGGVVAFPTDTVPGIGCLAASAEGVRALFELKARDPGKPLILFFADVAAALALAGAVDPRVRRLLDGCWPGPLTAVLPLTGTWPAGVGRDGTAGFRVADHPVAQALVAAAGEPLATTSANLSGEPPVGTADDAARIWGDRVFVLPGRAGGGEPSTVADCTRWPPRLLREGGLSEARLREVGETDAPKTA